MKKSVWVLGIVGMLVTTPFALDSGFGLGLILGDPSGLSARIATGPANSVNLIAGWDLGPYHRRCCGDGGDLYIGADYVWYNYNLIHVNQGRLPIYYGAGVNAFIANNSSAGIRAVVGLEYQFAQAPFDLFLEVGPGINLIPNTNGNVSGGFGARFFF